MSQKLIIFMSQKVNSLTSQRLSFLMSQKVKFYNVAETEKFFIVAKVESEQTL